MLGPTAALLALALAVSAPLPLPRPGPQPPAEEPAQAGEEPTELTAAIAASPTPPPRPKGLVRAARRAVATAPTERYGDPAAGVCGDPRLVGARGPDVLHPRLPCGIDDPVKLTRVGDILLSTPATLDCNTARTFADYLDEVARPATRHHLGADIAEVWVMASYACRTRNNVPGGKISEHGHGRAIDVGGVTLADGRQITVTKDWARGRGGRVLATMRSGACGRFSTVLGPGSDGFHQTHFHLDTAPRSGAAYCR